MGNLADALKNDIPAEEPADPIAPEETPDIADEFEAQAPTEPEKPEEHAKGEEEKPAEPEKPQAPDQVPWKALKAEREKRQKAEAELAYLRGRVDGQPKPKDEEPSADDLDNEFLLSPSATLDARVETKLESALRDVKANTSDAIMRMTKEDYPELLDEFAELANANPELWARARQEEMPALAIYNFMKARKAPQQQLNEEELKAKWRAEWEEEQKKKAALEEVEDITPSPAGAPGSGETQPEKVITVDDLWRKRRGAMGA